MPAPNTGYVGDLTYLPMGEGWLARAVVLALYSRAVVGWAMADHLRAAWVTQAWAMALGPRQPAAGRLMHTDRGRQSGVDSDQQRVIQHGMQPRRSRKGQGWENAVAECFFHT